MRAVAIVCLTCLTLAACGGAKRGLHDLSGQVTGPDEFAVQPTRPLELPQSLSALPTPTPGGGNRTDVNPNADAIAALGGNPAAASAGGIPTSDSALVTQASRHGVSPEIRSELAEADAQFRSRRSTGGFLRGRGRYFGVYANQSLNAEAEMTRFRNLGVQVPSAPPAN